jgi:hypothetical protein
VKERFFDALCRVNKALASWPLAEVTGSGRDAQVFALQQRAIGEAVIQRGLERARPPRRHVARDRARGQEVSPHLEDSRVLGTGLVVRLEFGLDPFFDLLNALTYPCRGEQASEDYVDPLEPALEPSRSLSLAPSFTGGFETGELEVELRSGEARAIEFIVVVASFDRVDQAFEFAPCLHGMPCEPKVIGD